MALLHAALQLLDAYSTAAASRAAAAALRWELQELLGAAAARLPAAAQARLLRLAMARHARLSVG